METYRAIIAELESMLAMTSDRSVNLREQAEYAIRQCKLSLDKLRVLVIREGFPDAPSEIQFFKQIKPAAYGRLLYYRSVFELESKRRQGEVSIGKIYLQKYMHKIIKYMEKHHVKVQYYRCGFTHLDEKYFLRGNTEIPLELKSSQQLMDEEFFTWHDHTFSVILAYDMLGDYIRKEIGRLEPEMVTGTASLSPPHRWSGKKVDLAELVYALHASRVIDAGRISIRELADLLGGLFGIELGKEIYRLHTEVQQRKTEPTKFMDFLGAVLRQRLEDSDA